MHEVNGGLVPLVLSAASACAVCCASVYAVGRAALRLFLTVAWKLLTARKAVSSGRASRLRLTPFNGIPFLEEGGRGLLSFVMTMLLLLLLASACIQRNILLVSAAIGGRNNSSVLVRV